MMKKIKLTIYTKAIITTLMIILSYKSSAEELPKMGETIPWGSNTNEKNNIKTSIVNHIFSKIFIYSPSKGLSKIQYIATFDSKYPLSECSTAYNYLKNIYGEANYKLEIDSKKGSASNYIWNNLNNSSLDQRCIIENNNVLISISFHPKFEIIDCELNFSKPINEILRITYFIDSWNNELRQFMNNEISIPIPASFSTNEISYTTPEKDAIFNLDRINGNITITKLSNNVKEYSMSGTCLKKSLDNSKF